MPLHPSRIAPSPIDRERNAFNIQQTPGGIPVLAPEALWVSFHLSSTQWKWNIRRPGEYAAQSIVGSIISNVDILINFSGFEDLTASNPSTQNIETYYGVSIGNQRVEEVEWVRASDFNARSLLIKQNTPTVWTVWNKVCVKAANPAFEYSGDAIITFVMQNTSTWIDSEIPTKR